MEESDFSNKNNLNIILSPHLDDAVLDLGGFIVKNLENTKIITIFSGKPKDKMTTIWDFFCGFRNSDIAVTERILENEKALNFLGLENENITNLDFLDRQYLSEQEVSSRNFNDLRSFLLKIISENKDKYINIFAPMTDIHKDHRDVRDFLITFLREKSPYSNNLRFFLYEDYPYFFKYKNSKEYLSKYKNNQVDIVLSKEELSKKVRAIDFYKSQFKYPFTSLSTFRKRIRSNKNHIFDKEVIYKIV